MLNTFRIGIEEKFILIGIGSHISRWIVVNQSLI